MDKLVPRHARAHNKMNIREKSNLFVSVQEAQQLEKNTRVRFHVCVEIVAGGGRPCVNKNSESARRERSTNNGVVCPGLVVAGYGPLATLSTGHMSAC